MSLSNLKDRMAIGQNIYEVDPLKSYVTLIDLYIGHKMLDYEIQPVEIAWPWFDLWM